MTRNIIENYERIRSSLPESVSIVVAAKTRTPEEIAAVIEAGATDIGQNYVQEAVAAREALGAAGDRARWHLIGALQRNKINKALPVVEVIQTVDSLKLAEAISRRAPRPVAILIEVNSGREPQKAGVMPEEAAELVRRAAELPNLEVEGLMTMGPMAGEAEAARPCFVETRRLFERLGEAAIPGVAMRTLSMGMSNSYLIAADEGSTMVRIGTAIFGARDTG